MSELNQEEGHLPKKPVPTLSGREVRCILFDLGDTLWTRKDKASWKHLEAVSNQRAAALLCQHIDPTSLPTDDPVVLGNRLREAMEEQVRHRVRSNPEIEPDGISIVKKALKRVGIRKVGGALECAIFEALRVRIPESRPLFADVLPTLAALQQRGFLLGIVTNRLWGGQPFQEDLRILGLLDYFDPRHMAVSGDLGIRKPNSAIFLHALNALHVFPEQAIMVGDSLRSDVAGAQKLGIFAVWKPKPRIREEVASRFMTQGAATAPQSVSGTHVPLEAVPPVIPDNDYVLAQIQSREGKWDAYLHDGITPDLVIEDIGDLLDVLAEVGVQ